MCIKRVGRPHRLARGEIIIETFKAVGTEDRSSGILHCAGFTRGEGLVDDVSILGAFQLESDV